MSQRNSEEGVRGGYQSAPICDTCWRRIAGKRKPIRLKARRKEACYRCGALNTSGIYVRTQVSRG